MSRLECRALQQLLPALGRDACRKRLLEVGREREREREDVTQGEREGGREGGRFSNQQDLSGGQHQLRKHIALSGLRQNK